MLNREILIQRKISDCEKKIERLHESFPRLKEIADEISRLSYERINNGILKKNNSRVNEIDRQVKLLIKEKEFILKANSIADNIYEPEWDCPKCKDRGYTTPGILCECYKQERLDAFFRQSGIKGDMENQTFASFDTSYYKDPLVIEEKLRRCKKFLENLAAGEKQNNLLFLGDVGRGKTHLSAAIANESLKRGITVVYKRIEELLDIIRDNKFQREGENNPNDNQLNLLKNVDLLIIDDLGSENITPFAENQIRILIDERNNLSKPWIINSNLSISELQRNYGQRLTDRIIAKTDIFVFESEMSIREILKRKNMQGQRNN
ncbi:MAG: ATP-binding protein [Bacillota bacterium]